MNYFVLVCYRLTNPKIGARILEDMKSIFHLLTFKKFSKAKLRPARSTKEELLVKYGREQFSQLMKKGLSIPVALL